MTDLSPWLPPSRDRTSLPEWAAVGLLVHATMERVGGARLMLSPAWRPPVSLDELARHLADVCRTHKAATLARQNEAMAIFQATGPSLLGGVLSDWRHAFEVEAPRGLFLPNGTRKQIRWDRLDLEGDALAHVIDWKTAEPHLSPDSMADDPQVARYLLGLRTCYPFHREHRVTFVWLGSDRVSSVAWAPALDDRVRFAAVRE